MKLDCSMCSEQRNLKGVYSWNKMWSSKGLAMFRLVELVYMQNNISDSKSGFAGQQVWLCS